jgi:uncharacterized OB-fold protein
VSGDWTEGAPVLGYRYCADCEHRWYLPKPRCPRCGGSVRRATSTGLGTVRAATTVHRAPSGGGHPPTPFGICLVELDESVQVMGRCASDTAVGQRVAVSFPDGVPYFSAVR